MTVFGDRIFSYFISKILRLLFKKALLYFRYKDKTSPYNFLIEVRQLLFLKLSTGRIKVSQRSLLVEKKNHLKLLGQTSKQANTLILGQLQT